MQIAILTGGSSGIGRAAAIRIAQRGTGVILTYNSNPDGARQTVATIKASGETAVAVHLDVGDSGTFPAFGEEIKAQLAEVWQRNDFDFLVNNAGFASPTMFEDMTEELFDRYYRVIMKGPYFLTQRLVPLMTDGGAIVNTTSNSALVTGLSAGYSGYSIMKAGLIWMTRCLAKELSPRRIRVNGVSPGSTRTRIADDAFEKHPEVIPPIAAQTALGRLGEPEDIGKIIAALLYEDFGWMTGENIEASGGFRL